MTGTAGNCDGPEYLKRQEQEIQEMQQTEQEQLDEEYFHQVEELSNDGDTDE